MKRKLAGIIAGMTVGCIGVFADIIDVVKAEYGAGSSWLDVTETVRNAIAEDRIEIDVNNTNFGDPAPGVGKITKAVFNYNGKQVVLFAKENTTFVVDKAALDKAPAFDPALSSKVEILKAEYGFEDKWLDVTDKVRDLVNSGIAEIEASNRNFTDPVPGHGKSLKIKIKYKSNGKEIEKRAPENEKIPLI